MTWLAKAKEAEAVNVVLLRQYIKTYFSKGLSEECLSPIEIAIKVAEKQQW